MPWFRVYPSTLATVPCFLAVCCWGCFAVVLWVLLWPYHPLPCLHCTGSLLSYWVTCRYLTFLAVDWLRTVSASRPLCFCLVCCLSSRWFALFHLLSLPFCLWACVGRCGPSPLPPLSVPISPGALSVFWLPPWLFVCPVLLAVSAYLGSSLSVALLGSLYPWVGAWSFWP